MTTTLKTPPKWDLRFLLMARHVSGWSKDPSTQTGAVITDGRRVVSVGYNGFAAGADDTEDLYLDRDFKIRTIVHCERNAIIFAQQCLHGFTLYTWPFMSCAACASMVIQAGIKRCVAPEASADKLVRWAEDFKAAKKNFQDCGVEVALYPGLVT